MDIVDTATRSRMMAGIKGRNTRPEMIVRRFLHANGYRFRLHRRDLPGSPDIVLPRFRTCIFVHGCFWHRHDGCRYATTPKTRADFWQAKFTQNVERDGRARRALRADGWKVLTIWECELRSPARILGHVLEFLRVQGEELDNL
ncbi:very short patch repair endonuclease [Pseudomonas sp. B8(2017)]|uniref:very short patch repair endonuclease n=1 Tax=Pseudomonas sp. B8(2017) TaxID=1981711 RepID=UPI000A1E59E1|nr:very short patch repair endonuclease [Pseudomonas sp. B8(2017)]